MEDKIIELEDRVEELEHILLDNLTSDLIVDFAAWMTFFLIKEYTKTSSTPNEILKTLIDKISETQYDRFMSTIEEYEDADNAIKIFNNARSDAKKYVENILLSSSRSHLTLIK